MYTSDSGEDVEEVQPRFISVRDIPDNLAMDSARNAVLQLEVHLGNGVFWEYRGIGDITNGGGSAMIRISFSNSERRHLLDHVADGESLYRLVLGGTSRAVGATDGLDMASARLVTAVGCALLDHFGEFVWR